MRRELADNYCHHCPGESGEEGVEGSGSMAVRMWAAAWGCLPGFEAPGSNSVQLTNTYYKHTQHRRLNAQQTAVGI